MGKKRIALLVGGLSSERDVSLVTGKAFEGALKELGYPYSVIDAQSDLPQRLMSERPDVALLALHGKYAEDGAVQGICEYLKIPYSGSGILGSALCMDKILSKQILMQHQVPTADFEMLQFDDATLKNFKPHLAPPFVVKPSRDGSSMGITICQSREELAGALQKAAQYDRQILVESYLEGPELTVSILNDRALTPIEIRPKQGFYDYKNKYTAGQTEYILPPQVNAALIKEVQELALKAHQVLQARTYSRVDFRLHRGRPYVLEVNTLPGCTPTSLLPKAAQHDGISFVQVIDILIEKASLDYAGVR